MKVLSGPTELKTLRDAPGCGKRSTRENKESSLAECLWDCEVNKDRGPLNLPQVQLTELPNIPTFLKNFKIFFKNF